jgi:hypothetical protein
MKVQILNNILTKETNKKIINNLTNHHWFLAWENKMDRVEKIFSNKNSGFSLTTFDEGKIVVDSILNIYGELVFDIITDKLKIKAKLERIFWNMYLKESQGELHTDRSVSNFVSAVYNLHTTDGGIEIDGKFYNDIEGQAKVFDSNILHRGFGPKQDNVRFNLNLIFKI